MTTVPILPENVQPNDVGHLAVHDALADFANGMIYPDQTRYYASTDFVTISGIVAPREQTIASSATWAINTASADIFTVTAQAVNVASILNPAGTPVQGQSLMIRAKDNGVARTLAWTGSQWRAAPGLPLPTTTTAGKTMYLGFVWNDTDAHWDLLAFLNGF